MPFKDAIFKKVEEIAHETFEVTFTLKEPLGFKPGQYVWIIIPTLHYPDSRGNRRAFSISSSSEDQKNIKIIFRKSGSGYKRTLLDLKEGSKVKLRGPLGNSFVLKGGENVCFVAGGVGIAPFLSIIRSINTFSDKPTIRLVNLNSTSPKRFYTSELQKYSEEKKIEFVDYVGKFSSNLLEGLSGKKGADYFICGQQGMVNDVYKKLKALGIKDVNMRFEEYYPKLKGTESLVAPLESAQNLRNRLVQKFVTYYSLLAVVALICLIIFYSFVVPALLSEILVLVFILFLFSANYITFMILKNLKIFVNGSLGLTLIILSWVLWYGTLNGVGVYWIYGFPVLAFFVVGRRLGAIWSGIYALIIAFVYFLSIYHLSPYAYGPILAFISLITLAAMTFIAYFASEITDVVVGNLNNALDLYERYKLAVDSSSDHTIITDVNGTILYANKAAEKVTGYSLSEMLGTTPRLWGGNMEPKFYKKMWKTLSGEEQFFVGEVKNTRKSGEIYSSILRVSPILDRNLIIGYVATEEDVSERERLEREKSDFMSAAAHQLRTPLGSMRWSIETLLEGGSGKLDKKAKETIKQIYESDLRIIDLVNDLLDVSRIEQGRIKDNPAITDVKKLIESIIEETKPIADKRKTGLRFLMGKGKIPEIMIDPERLREAIENLVTNSIKYGDFGGSVEVKLGLKDEKILISVSNGGEPIPVKDQNKIFTKFYRGTDVVKNEIEGTGLGLYVVKSYVEGWGGKVWFKSPFKDGKGACFYIEIPLHIKAKKM